jgi:hypothetical protein
MNGASKILTVSYGTFSCTLEGFEDPFSTMKAIAEYFRDLAADDRYFGAEPPQPDAAMLHRIAEREIQRRVETRVEDNAVTLRASADARPMATPTITMPAVSAAPAVAPFSPTLLSPAEGLDSVAARLARMRGETAAAAAAPVATDAPWTQEPYTEDQHAAVLTSAETLQFAAPTATPKEEPVLPVPDLAPLAALEADAGLGDVSYPAVGFSDDGKSDAGDFVAEPEISGTGIEAALVVAEDAAFELTTHEAALTHPSPDQSSAEADDILGIVMKALEKPQPVLTDDLVAAATVEPASLTASKTIENTVAREEDVAIDLSSVNLTEVSAAVIPVAEESQAVILSTVPDAVVETLVDAPFEATPAGSAHVDPAAVLAPAQRARARVIRIRRADVDALQPIARDIAIEGIEAAKALVEPASDPAVTAGIIAAPAPVSSLTAEAEADLLAELASLHAELTAAQEPASTAIPVPAPPTPVVPSSAAPSAEFIVPRRPAVALRRNDEPEVTAPKAEATKTAEVELERIIARANSALGDASNQRRHSAIQHLKAAVAATEADRIAMGGLNARQQDPEADFRQDLNRVVGDASANGSRAGSDRPAPLVLVSAQRIDRPQDDQPKAAPDGGRVLPVRPVRRARGVNTATALQQDEIDVHAPLILTGGPKAEPDAITADDRGPGSQSFPEFARILGASTLAEQIEAAAVFRATVQEQPAFGRASLSSLIASLGGAEVDRAAYFAAFGQLVDSGHLTEIDGDRFVLTDRSPYLRMVEDDE